MKLRTWPDEPIAVPKGCRFSGVTAGIKASGNPDLAYAEFPAGTTAAAVFTRNRVVAAPVVVGREHLEKSRGHLRALVVNAGNANCATGRPGLKAARKVCAVAGKLLRVSPDQIFPSSTGIIGVPLPVEKLVRALPQAVEEQSRDSAMKFARAIMTTDTRPKLATAGFDGGVEVRLLAIGKGAGMIHPQLATMLVYVFTDIQASPRDLQSLLNQACDQTFNCISVDGDTSTNDTVLLVATGASGVALNRRTRDKFQQPLNAVCGSIAEQIIADAEGAKHRVRVRIEQARDREEARAVARAIAHSPLVKTAWAGADPNWGRILAAIGYSGVPVDPERINIFLGPHHVCRGGMRSKFDETKAHQYLLAPDYEIRVQLGRGRAELRFLSCDLTAEYVRINADYST
jgi:glutamate N-acetyltransferase/amino-acid N-acetyltransferase